MFYCKKNGGRTVKKKIVSMALALTLVITGIPTVPVNAAEVSDSVESVVIENEENESEEESESEESESEESESEEESNSEAKEVKAQALDSEDAESYVVEEPIACLGENGQAVGTNGVTYDDVTYLGFENVCALSEDLQSKYVEICDEIADCKDSGYELEEFVIALDGDGNLHYSYSVPYAQINEVKNEMLIDAIEATTEEVEEATTEVEEVTTTEVEEVTTTEEVEEVTTTEVEEVTTTEVEETTTEEVEETTTEVEEATTEEVEEETTEEVEETTTEVEEETTEIETEEKLTSVAENMDILPVLENETFEVADDVKADMIVDLGYTTDTSDVASNSATYMNANYFYNQLNSTEQIIYNAAKGAVTSGNTTFSFTASRYSTMQISVAQALSAIILTYPEKTDWTDKTGGFRVSGSYYIGSSTANYTVKMDKSSYYNSTLVKESNAKVKELAAAAQKSALSNSPTDTVYGIIKYFDSWICKNNYYNKVGTYNPGNNVTNQRIFYYCHTSYGILLKGYGVCESYALAMNRLLDSVGIPNAYVTGKSFGEGHAWNYVQMPDGKWYMLDSTWNDSGSASSGKFLLSAKDSNHSPIGNGYTRYRAKFQFPALSSSKYTKSTTKPTFKKSQYNVVVGKTFTLTYSNEYAKRAKKKWTSSNKEVATVNSKGVVTAKKAGTATITLNAGGMVMTCKVNVHKITNVAFNDIEKRSRAVAVEVTGEAATAAQAKSYKINVTQQGSIYNTKQLIDNKVYGAPVIKTTNKKVATATYSVTGNTITVKIVPAALGSAKVTMKFAGKTFAFNVTVKRKLNSSWFDTSAVPKSVEYKGSAYKPAIKKVATKAPKGMTYKVVHTNNVNAGTASVTIKGTGKYTGEITKTYTITPINLKDAKFKSCTASKVYNGGVLKASTKVVCKGKTLKANRDYVVKYGTSTEVKNVGKYKVTIVGKGNYTGTLSATPAKTFEIKANKITNVKVSCKSSIKYTGATIKPVTAVKIGKNVLPTSDYTIVYCKDNANRTKVTNLKDKGKYVAVITVKGKNVLSTSSKTQIVKKFTIK